MRQSLVGYTDVIKICEGIRLKNFQTRAGSEVLTRTARALARQPPIHGCAAVAHLRLEPPNHQTGSER